LDYVALQTVEPGGRGVVFTAGQTVARTFDRRTRRSWVRINTHIAAGRRLRHSMNLKAAVDEAILAPSDKLEHAEGEGGTKRMREALRDAVLRSEKARGKQRRTDPEAATEAWTAMVSGRWSLVDRFERGGRRYIVARRNEHNLPDPRALTQRECVIANLAALGKPNKLIGYELGVSESAVGTHLSQAMRKLGAKSRVDLIQLVAQLGVPRSEP
jgi:DNA-binding CsgD family transcriptional regulator